MILNNILAIDYPTALTPMNVSTKNIALSGAWAPLHHRVFRMLWIASIVSNIGSWMHEVGAGWLMTSLASSPLMVALVQAATTAPVFLLALPSGALADIVDYSGPQFSDIELRW